MVLTLYFSGNNQVSAGACDSAQIGNVHQSRTQIGTLAKLQDGCEVLEVWVRLPNLKAHSYTLALIRVGRFIDKCCLNAVSRCFLALTFATSLCTNILPMASFWILNIVGTKEFTESPCKRCIKQTTNQPQVNKVYQKLHARRLVRVFEKWDLTVRTLDSS